MGALLQCWRCTNCWESDGEVDKGEAISGDTKKEHNKASSSVNSFIPLSKDSPDSSPLEDVKETISGCPSSEYRIIELCQTLPPLYDFKDLFSQLELAEQLCDSPQAVEHKYESGAVYIGQVQDGNRHGNGTMRWRDGVEYSGIWAHGLPCETGTMKFAEKSFSGLWRNPDFHGDEVVLAARLDRMEDWLQAFNDGYGKELSSVAVVQSEISGRRKE